MSKVNSPHDKLFKVAMKDIRVAREFFESYLPEEIRSMVDLNQLELCPNSYIDEELKGSASDILYKTVIGKEPAYLFLLAEHQSSPDRLLPFRLIKYMIRIWDEHISQNKSKKLPLIIPIVFYHGRTPYIYSCDFRDLIAAPQDLIEKFLFAPFHLVDTHEIPDETLREQQWFGTMAFFMKHIFERDFLPYLKEALFTLHRLEQSKGSNLVVNLIHYVITTTEINIEKFIETVKDGLSTSTGEQIMTTAEQLIQRGMQRGKLQGEQVMLTQLLQRRFPFLNARYEDRIKNARSEELLLWSERIFDAKSVEEVFED